MDDDAKANRKKVLVASTVAMSMALFLILSTLTIWQVHENWSVLFPSKGEFYQKSLEKAKEKKLKEALELLDLSIKAKENKSESYVMRAEILEKLGRHEESLKDLQYLAKTNPQSSLEYHHRAYSLIQDDGSPKEIVRLETMAIAIDPKNPKFYVNRSNGLSELKQYKEAIADCTTGLALKPSDESITIALIINRADSLNSLGSFEACLKDCDDVLSRPSLTAEDKLEIYLSQIASLISTKDYDKALTSCDDALKLIKDNDEDMLQFSQLKLKALEARNDKPSNDAAEAAKLREQCKKLKASIDVNDAADADGKNATDDTASDAESNSEENEDSEETTTFVEENKAKKGK